MLSFLHYSLLLLLFFFVWFGGFEVNEVNGMLKVSGILPCFTMDIAEIP